jgi:hypothetical protein
MISFSHKNYDGMRLLLVFSKSEEEKIILPCICTLFYFVSFIKHLFISLDQPFFNIPNNRLWYESIKIQKSSIQNLGRYSIFLCALQVLTYFQKSKCKYCKLQIIHYLPWMDGINKTFPDVMIVPTDKCCNFKSIYQYIETHRKNSIEIWKIYEQYNLWSFWTNEFSPILFDVTFSYLSCPVQLKRFEIIHKSVQYEKCYMNVISNFEDEIFISFVHDEVFKDFSDVFLSNLNHIIEN